MVNSHVFFLKVLEGLLEITCDWKEDVRHFVHFKVNTHQVQFIIYSQCFLVHLCVCMYR